MKKTFCLALLLSVCGTLGHADERALEAPASKKAQSIDSQINELQELIQMHRKAALNAEMEAQTYLPVEWDRYSKRIRESEEHENSANALEKHLSELLFEKQSQSQNNDASKK